MLQADASRCGGISEAKRIADLAGAHHLHAIPHTFSDALTIAANLHVVAASSNAPIIEYDRTYNEIQEKLVTNPLDVHDSVIELPTQPGLGVDIDWDFVADHPYSGEIGHRRRLATGLRARHRGDSRPDLDLARVKALTKLAAGPRQRRALRSGAALARPGGGR